jgi:hypothetical protein
LSSSGHWVTCAARLPFTGGGRILRRSRTDLRAPACSRPSGALASRPSTAASARSYPGAARTASSAAVRPCLPAACLPRGHRGHGPAPPFAFNPGEFGAWPLARVEPAASRAACNSALRACWSSSAARAAVRAFGLHLRGPPRRPRAQRQDRLHGPDYRRAGPACRRASESSRAGAAGRKVRHRQRAIRLRPRPASAVALA